MDVISFVYVYAYYPSHQLIISFQSFYSQHVVLPYSIDLSMIVIFNWINVQSRKRIHITQFVQFVYVKIHMWFHQSTFPYTKGYVFTKGDMHGFPHLRAREVFLNVFCDAR